MKEKCLKWPLLLTQTCNQRHSLKLTCINLSRQHSANQHISLKYLLWITKKKTQGAVITAWGRWYNKMHFKRNTRKWFFSYVQRNVTTSIKQNPDPLVLGTRSSLELWPWLKLSVLCSLRPAAKELLTIIMLLLPILLIKPVILLHIETWDMVSPASLPASPELSGVQPSASLGVPYTSLAQCPGHGVEWLPLWCFQRTGDWGWIKI